MASLTQPGERSSEFTRFWLGEAVSGLGSAITSLALQTLVLVTLQGNAVQVGWLNSARWLPYLVLGLVVGALVDRVRRRPVMVVTDVARAGLLGLIPLAWGLDVLELPAAAGRRRPVRDGLPGQRCGLSSFRRRLVPRMELQRAHARLDGAGAVAQTRRAAMAGMLDPGPGRALVGAGGCRDLPVLGGDGGVAEGGLEPTATMPATVGARGVAQEVTDGHAGRTARRACVASPSPRTSGSRVRRSGSCWSSRTAISGLGSHRCSWASCSLSPASVRCSVRH